MSGDFAELLEVKHEQQEWPNRLSMGTRADFLPFPSILPSQAKVLPVSPIVVYPGRYILEEEMDTIEA